MTTDLAHCGQNPEQPVQTRQIRDLRGAGLSQPGQELAPDSPEKSFYLPPALWPSRLAVDQLDAQLRAGPQQPRSDERRPVIHVVPTSAQRRLCRPADYAEPGAKGLLAGGERAESIGIILSLVIIVVPPISEGGTDGQTGEQGDQGAGDGPAGSVRADGEGKAARARLYAAEHGDRDAAGGAPDPLAGCRRAPRGPAVLGPAGSA